METAAGLRESMHIFGNNYYKLDGTGIRDYIHVSDLVVAQSKALKYISENNENLTLNVATGKGYSVLEVIENSRHITGSRINYQFSGKKRRQLCKINCSIKFSL
tara:strand:+ start:66 stop:377 length:312 start_codon:yes stop_codon:yes gene_type:complete